MSITHISSATSGRAGESAANSISSVSMPSGYQAGDLLIANLALEFNRTLSREPVGWTLLPDMPVIHEFGNVHIRAYYKFAEANEPAIGWRWRGGLTRYSVIIDAYRGVDATGSQPWASRIATNNSGFSEFAVSGVTSENDESLLVGYVAGHTVSQRDIRNTEDRMDRHALVTGRSAATFSEVRPEAGSTGSRTFDLSTSTGGGGYLIAIRPGIVVDDEEEEEPGDEDDSQQPEPQEQVPARHVASSTSGSAGENAANATTSVSMPNGYQTGDLLITNLALEFNRPLSSEPAGWKLLPDMPIVHSFGNVHIHAYYKFAEANEPAIGWSWGGGSSRYSVTIDAYRGVDATGSQPWASSISTNNSGFSEFAVSGVTIQQENALLLAHVAGHTSSPRDITNTQDRMTRHALVTGRSAATFSEVQEAAGDSGTRSFSLAASTGGGGYLIAIRPVPVVDEDVDDSDGEDGDSDDQVDPEPVTPTNVAVVRRSTTSLTVTWDGGSRSERYTIERERWSGPGDPN